MVLRMLFICCSDKGTRKTKTKKIRFMGTEEKMQKTESGHWGLKIGKPKEKTEYSKKVGIDFMLWMKEESCESLSKEKKAMLKEEMCLLIQEKNRNCCQ